MIDQQHRDIGLRQGFGHVAEAQVVELGQLRGKAADVGLGGQQLARPSRAMAGGDLQRRAFAQVVDVGLVGQAEAGDHRRRLKRPAQLAHAGR